MMKRDGQKAEITLDRVKALVSYDAETGHFTSLVNRRRIRVGDRVGALKNGYISICLDYVEIYAHRLAIWYTSGIMPELEIDHIDGNRANNVLSNLRVVPRRTNLQNRRRAIAKSTSGLIGAHKQKSKTWRSAIKVDGVNVYLGSFPTAEAAHIAYLDAKRKLHTGCTI